MLTIFLSAALYAGPALSVITPATVGRMIDRYGARQTVQMLSSAHSKDAHAEFGKFDKVLDGIATGGTHWLRLVPRLAPGTDAGIAESLPIVIAKALPKNPAGVLRLIKRDASWIDACGYPMIEPTRKEMRAYFKVAIPAVQSVHDPALQSAKRSCVSELLKAQRTP